MHYNYNSRIHRHNYLNNLLIQQLNMHKYITITEPYIETTNGLRKPDVLIYKIDFDTAYTTDTQIPSDTINTNNYKQNTDYYNSPDIIMYAKQATGCNTIIISASSWDWRAIPSSQGISKPWVSQNEKS